MSNLDYKVRLELRHELRALQQRIGITAVYVTHDREEALTLADRIAVIDAGRVAQYGTPEEVFHRPAIRVRRRASWARTIALLLTERADGSARAAAGAPVEGRAGARALPRRRGAARGRHGEARCRRGALPGVVEQVVLRRAGLSLSRADRTTRRSGCMRRSGWRKGRPRPSSCRATRCWCSRRRRRARRLGRTSFAPLRTSRSHARGGYHALSSIDCDRRYGVRSPRAVAAGRSADTLNVVTAGDQNMVDYVNDFLGPQFEKMNPGVKVRAVGHRPGRLAARRRSTRSCRRSRRRARRRGTPTSRSCTSAAPRRWSRKTC